MKTSITFGNNIIDYTIVRRRKKSVGISISAERGIEVSAPTWVSQTEIQNILRSKASWILKKLTLMNTVRAGQIERRFTSGEGLLYLGREYLLEISEKEEVKSPRVWLDQHTIQVTLPAGLSEQKAEVIRKALTAWYRVQAAEQIKNRVRIYSDKMEVHPLKIVIKEQKRGWGSCSSKCNLNFNWKIVMAPGDIIDYLVVHELAHLKEMNHSKQFWGQVEAILPDYKERSKWLKANGRRLTLD